GHACMNANPYAILVNLLGFITGGLLYGMLLLMVFRGTGDSYSFGSGAGTESQGRDRLPLVTAILGLGWNIVALVVYGLPGLGVSKSFPLLVAAAFTALGFLPAVVVHSVLRTGRSLSALKGGVWITASAYLLSGVTSVIQFTSAVRDNTAPSQTALLALTIGYLALTPVLLLITRRDPGWRRALWVVALAVFSVSALHLSHHVGNDYPWWTELIGHHASLLLVLAILYQDYRFALADIFLKRALVLVILVAIAFGLYAAFSRELPFFSRSSDADPRAVSLLLGLWVGTALLYPLLRRSVAWFVDSLILRRVDYNELRVEIARAIGGEEDTKSVLNVVCEKLAMAMTARQVTWAQCEETPGSQTSLAESGRAASSGTARGNDRVSSVNHDEHRLADLNEVLPSAPIGLDNNGARSGASTVVAIPTVDSPRFIITIADLAAGRRLMSDDLAMLEAVALQTARAIDRVRVAHERCERDLREQHIGKLVTEAELRALRAQINPHFLFNALTTIGYLIEAAPDRALTALLRLTGLLRGTLQRSSGEFTTLGQEIDLVETYLEIERARYEERLRINIDVPPAERCVRIPSLLVQPVVENAVKHGVAPLRSGGEVSVRARLLENTLCISVRDTGAGTDDKRLAIGRANGVGLANIEDRLRCHYGDDALMSIHSEPGLGTEVEIRLPVPIKNEPLLRESTTTTTSTIGAIAE
ncbi:MAG: histidine kinase, partial [Blastocatellia bacterium]